MREDPALGNAVDEDVIEFAKMWKAGQESEVPVGKDLSDMLSDMSSKSSFKFCIQQLMICQSEELGTLTMRYTSKTRIITLPIRNGTTSLRDMETMCLTLMMKLRRVTCVMIS
jgi:hypothetical protein